MTCFRYICMYKCLGSGECHRDVLFVFSEIIHISLLFPTLHPAPSIPSEAFLVLPLPKFYRNS